MQLSIIYNTAYRLYKEHSSTHFGQVGRGAMQTSLRNSELVDGDKKLVRRLVDYGDNLNGDLIAIYKQQQQHHEDTSNNSEQISSSKPTLALNS